MYGWAALISDFGTIELRRVTTYEGCLELIKMVSVCLADAMTLLTCL